MGGAKRWPILILPSLTLGGAATLVGWGSLNREECSARVWGGPTDGLAVFSGWVESCVNGPTLAGGQLKLEARARPGAQLAGTEVTLDDEGRAEFHLDFGDQPPGEFYLRVEHAGRLLAEGRVALSRARFFGAAGERGGYLTSRSAGALEVRGAPERGALAVPFDAPLRLEVRAEGAPLAGVDLELRAEGARLSTNHLKTNGRGEAQVIVTPQEHTVFFTARATTIDAGTGESRMGELRSSVPVVPGACVVERGEEHRFLVKSPVERDAVFVTLIDDKGRLAGSAVRLRPNGVGQALGTWDVSEPWASQAKWAVCSSDPRGSGAALVGWPLAIGVDGPAHTRDVADVLLLDGEPARNARNALRRRWVHRLALMWGALGAGLSVAWVWVSSNRERRRIERELTGVLDARGVEQLTQTQAGLRLWVLCLIALGFLGLVALLALRLR
ncbi:MAG TPA: hypothetical protein VFQ61_28710 [Polyangiaceae bacterium]|nr:hypothetical protein [Polyangiaceae bacterium]